MEKNILKHILFFVLIALFFQYVALFEIDISKPFASFNSEKAILCANSTLYGPVVSSSSENKNNEHNAPSRRQLRLFEVLFLSLFVSIYYYFRRQYIVVNRRKIMGNLLLKHFHESKYKSEIYLHDMQKTILLIER